MLPFITLPSGYWGVRVYALSCFSVQLMIIYPRNTFTILSNLNFTTRISTQLSAQSLGFCLPCFPNPVHRFNFLFSANSETALCVAFKLTFDNPHKLYMSWLCLLFHFCSIEVYISIFASVNFELNYLPSKLFFFFTFFCITMNLIKIGRFKLDECFSQLETFDNQNVNLPLSDPSFNPFKTKIRSRLIS